ncbi:MAG: PD-(D/E)XK nuclease family protein [Pseudonocardiales bacterium]
MNPVSAGLAEHLREVLWTAWATWPRSVQPELGMSEVGTACERQIGYKTTATPRCNVDSDPLPSIVGIGMHLWLAELFRRADGGSGRYLLEQPVIWRGLTGTADCLDRRRRTLLDWKTTAKRKLSGVRKDGPMVRYIVQVQCYAAGLQALGELVERVALIFIPRDGELADLHVWSAPVDHTVADEWADRYERIAACARADGPGALAATPTRLCGWCAHHRPGSTDLSLGCPGTIDLPRRD